MNTSSRREWKSPLGLVGGNYRHVKAVEATDCISSRLRRVGADQPHLISICLRVSARLIGIMRALEIALKSAPGNPKIGSRPELREMFRLPSLNAGS